MNDKFFNVKTDKQERIINAAMKVFAMNGYRKASTDLIVKEADISKGLLFHYFDNKITLYGFLIEYAIRLLSFEMSTSVDKNERDFFEIINQMERAKFGITRHYPYLIRFLTSLKFETDKQAVEAIGDNATAFDDICNSMYKNADNTKFQDYVVIRRVVKMLGWMSDGFLNDNILDTSISAEEMHEEYSKYIKMMKAHFYRGGLVGVNEEDIE